MKMTVFKLFQLEKEDKKKREALQTEISNLVQRESELAVLADEAASHGDVDAYMKKKAEKENVSSAIFVKRSYLDKLPKAVTEKDAFEAWSGYVDEYNTKLGKALADFREQREKLCRMYSELVSLQHNALATREHLAEMTGTNKELFDMTFIPVRSGLEEKGLLRLNGFIGMDTDAVYYLACYCQKNDKSIMPVPERDPEEMRITKVVIEHNSK